ncbi:RDD family protein [Janibacter sp. GXQ6167]|uniref:RDD family protein n=1 Tax=Janibacter sp. GXQ6167 TaxID=3240791 RepID=UPI003524F3F7
MSTTPTTPGWYDDPDDEGQLRYFDGIVWSERRVPKQTRPRTSERQEIAPGTDVFGRPPEQQPGHRPSYPPSGQVPGYRQRFEDNGGSPRPMNPYGAPTYPGTSILGGATTVDGEPLATYGRRVGAYLIDMLIQGALSLLFAGYFLWQGLAPYFRVLSEAAASGDQERLNQLQTELSRNPEQWVDMGQIGIGVLIGTAVAIIYHVGFVAWKNATPGKLVLGLRIRRTGHPGPVGFAVALRRYLLVVAANALSNLPLIGLVAPIVLILDLLWPAWDQRRQALHDKIADTQVIRVR